MPNWDRVCRRIVDEKGLGKCVRELEGLELPAPEPQGFFQTETGHYVVGGVAALMAIWAYNRIRRGAQK